MEYIVCVRQGCDEIKVKFTDSIRANMFAEMAANGIMPNKYYTGAPKDVKITLEFVAVNAEPIEPAADDCEQDEPAEYEPTNEEEGE